MLSKTLFQPMSFALAIAAAMTLPVSAAETLVPLDNLLDDNAATSLADAIASDTYGASAGTDDLGVVTVIDAGHSQAMNTAVTIAPGLSFDYSSVGGGSVNPRAIQNDRWGNPEPIRTTGTSTGYTTGGKIEDGLGMHANSLITFDLNALRSAGLESTAALFTAYYDQNDDQAANGSHRGTVVVSDVYGNVIAGYVNGQKVDVTKAGGVWSFTGTIPGTQNGSAATGVNFNVGLAKNAAYITLAATDTDVTADHAVWSTPLINAAPVIQLGNLFDDANTATLWNALATDTYKASAGTDDLGVDTLQSGNLDVAQNLNTGGVQFNFASAGGGSASSDGLVNDAIGAGGTSRPPLRLDGTAAGFPDSVDWDTKIEDGIGVHANRFVTFDLDEIRDAGDLGATGFQFTTQAGLNDSGIANNNNDGILAAVLLSDDTGVIAGYINGQLIDLTESGGIWSFDAINDTIPDKYTATSAQTSAFFDIFIDFDVKYLTLAAIGGSNINTDHVAFVDANLVTAVPAPVALPAGLTLLGAMTLRRRR
ncbi:hypothetical protein HED60_01900 [Planctomycetales bacterium ZRK34]|nr:hypothetical protein HED60_01900 [Planctomycetales bacterium ZRK34]